MEQFPPPTPQQWQDIEQNVDEAETAHRTAAQASHDLRDETGLLKVEREDLSKEEVLETVSRKRVASKAFEREEVFTQEAENMLGSEDSPERALVGLRRRNLIAAFRRQAMLEVMKDDLLKEETAILKNIEAEPSGAELEALDELRKELSGIEAEEQQLLESTPEAHYGLHLRELKEYKESLQRGRIVETEYVQEKAQDIVAHLQANKPVMIYGHLGTGKTELAMHIARNYMEKEALIVSGSKHTSLAELYGHQVLAIDRIDQQELDGFIQTIEQKFAEWAGQNGGASEEDKSRAHDRILQTYLAGLKGGTISEFFLGPIYRAMQDGRPVILDEVNAIPHEVLISLNHILTRRVGDKLNVQQDSGMEVEVAEGFGIMATGNLNQGQERYIDREDMDPAFLSRLYKIEYDYLPQKTEGSLEDEAGQDNELFELLIARVMDNNGNIEAPTDTMKKLWNLSKAARLTQDVFAGREVNAAYYFQEAGGRPTKYMLKESVLSLRALDHVVSQWQQEGYKQELDYYLWKEFVSQSTVASDRAYLYQMFKDRFGFFKSDGWDQSPSYGSGGLVQTFDITPPTNASSEKKFTGPRQTVDATFGRGPERTVWPEVVGGEIAAETETGVSPEIMGLEEWSADFDQEIAKLESEVEESCRVEGAPAQQAAPAQQPPSRRGIFGRRR